MSIGGMDQVRAPSGTRAAQQATAQTRMLLLAAPFQVLLPKLEDPCYECYCPRTVQIILAIPFTGGRPT